MQHMRGAETRQYINSVSTQTSLRTAESATCMTPLPCRVVHQQAAELTLRIVRKMVASCSTGMVRMRCRKPTGTPEAGWVGYMARPLARAATAPACTHSFHS